ncbi:helix-turn-helix transcriptional regulator [Streptomyces microflavus]|uniref:PadR family transcriptional regulator n=1 Tax=Streptomyces microflavus TaxID=1919 RepID=UPI00225A7219|nr:helix-turn-helix transcriptional regulator [Streptomyces microflavus]MCX4657300.1 PadR family transcriptional regulator [Streptomyces microflavus]
MGEPRMTMPTRAVLAAFMAKPADEHYGLEVSEAAGLAPGSIYPILIRLEQCGWLESRWEDIDKHAEGRPARRYYRLSEKGAQDVPLALARVRGRRRTGAVTLRPEGGLA